MNNHDLLNIIHENLVKGNYVVFKKLDVKTGRNPKPIQNFNLCKKYIKEGRTNFYIVNKKNDIIFSSFKTSPLQNEAGGLIEETLKNSLKTKQKNQRDKQNNNYTERIDPKSVSLIDNKNISNKTSSTSVNQIGHDSFICENVEKSTFIDAFTVADGDQGETKGFPQDLSNINKNNKFTFYIIKDGKSIPHRIPKPNIYIMNEEEEDEYIRLYKGMYYEGNRKRHTDWDHCRFMEMLAVRKPPGIDAFDLTLAPASLFAKIWINDSGNHPKILFIEDENESAYFLFNNHNEGRSNPYTKMSENQVLLLLQQYLSKLFNNRLPTTISDFEFTKNLLQNIKPAVTLTKREMNKKLPPGVFFKNGYVFHTAGKKLLDFKPFSDQMFCEHPFDIIPNISIFEKDSRKMFRQHLLRESQMLSNGNKRLLGNEEQLFVSERKNYLNEEDPLQFIQSEINDEQFKIFIEVITENDPLKIIALRSIIQRVIMARREGRRYQQCFWLWGSPGTSKTTWLSIAKMLAQGATMELSRTGNQFTSTPLEHCKLLLISDVNKLNTEMIQIIRNILGRDTIYGEIKHANKYHIIQPYCQIILVTNKDPNDYPQIMSRPELRDKITPLQFTESIPQEFMIGNLEEYIKKFVFKFFLWAIFTPRFLLQQQTRAKLINNFMNAKGMLTKSFIHYYIEERLELPNDQNEENYVLKSELRSDFELWLAENSLMEEFNDIKNTIKYFPNQLCEILLVDYQIKTIEKRRRINNLRNYVIEGIQLSGHNSNETKGKKIHLPVGESFDFKGLDPYSSIEPINEEIIDTQSFIETQKSILEYRRKKSDKSNND